jgi:hypothetical protein
MPDYNKGKIYTLRCRTDDNLIYVGSTIQALCERLAQHKCRGNDNKNKNRLVYTTINNEWDKWYIELYELYPCNCKEELSKREGEIIRQIATLNSRIEGRTHKEYYLDNKERLNIINTNNYQNNKEEIKLKFKERYNNNKEELKKKITCECGCIISKHHLNSHKKTQRHTNFLNAVKSSI